MKVIFLGQAKILHPWFDDVVSACAARGHEVVLFDPQSNVDDQFKGAIAVVDHGGGMGTPELHEAAKRAGVKLWQVHGTGYDHVDRASIARNGLRLATTPGPFSAIALAEHAMYIMLHFAKNHNASQQTILKRQICLPMNGELNGKTLGIYGFGASGRELAIRAHTFGMRLMAVDAVAIPDEIKAKYCLDFSGLNDSLPRLFADADYLSIHVPLNDSTRNAIDRQALASMKLNVVIINVSRGAVINEEAVIEALKAKRIRGLGQDTCWREPIDPDDPLLKLENVFVTPHVAGVTWETSIRRGEAIAENVDRVAKGREPAFRLAT